MTFWYIIINAVYPDKTPSAYLKSESRIMNIEYPMMKDDWFFFVICDFIGRVLK